ncbi:MAG TPA: YqiA/YcfP family alpha/beta fold hydrolase [Casimicrobiaceae bacterium]|nr:YqiA/YcfP family alpha/beta fold hydrolase [Casimicrobiaceae bacterium]
MTRIAYLHGFNSSPASVKGQLLARAIDALPSDQRPEFYLPRLSHRPADAVGAVCAWVERAAPGHAHALTFVGSSLGGFYATYLAERYGAKAVLINPAIRPDLDLATYVGRQRNLHTGEGYELRAADVAELGRFRVQIAHPERYLLLVQSGDEVLDYRAAVRFYAGAWQFVQGGGDHAFRDFATQLPALLRFAGVRTEERFRDAAMPGTIARS